jgi:hypothetical protein
MNKNTGMMVAWTIVLIAGFEVGLSQWFSIIGLLSNATLIMVAQYIVLIASIYAAYTMFTMKHK